MDRSLKFSFLSLGFNIVFGAYHILSGVLTHSWWLLSVGVYYGILGIVRFIVLRTGRSNRFITRCTGVMLMALSLPLAGTVVLAVVQDRGTVMHQIIMIAMAAYAFTKITLAIVNLVRSGKSSSVRHITLRNLSLADACVSIFALQRSMLVSFGEMPKETVCIFNAGLGTAVCLVVLFLGIHLLMYKKHLFVALETEENTPRE